LVPGARIGSFLVDCGALLPAHPATTTIRPLINTNRIIANTIIGRRGIDHSMK